MSLVRMLVGAVIVGVVLFVIAKAVSVSTDGDKVRITIDKQELRQAGHHVMEQGRKAAEKTADLLEQGEKTLEEN